MKRLSALAAVAILGLLLVANLAGCGDDKGTGPKKPKEVIQIVNELPDYGGCFEVTTEFGVPSGWGYSWFDPFVDTVSLPAGTIPGAFTDVGDSALGYLVDSASALFSDTLYNYRAAGDIFAYLWECPGECQITDSCWADFSVQATTRRTGVGFLDPDQPPSNSGFRVIVTLTMDGECLGHSRTYTRETWRRIDDGLCSALGKRSHRSPETHIARLMRLRPSKVE